MFRLTRRRMPETGILLSAALFSITALTAHGQTTVQHHPIPPAAASSGKEMYNAYCAVCHGTEGKGDGPAASALKTPPTDLTMLAESHGGKYPASYVQSVIRFGEGSVSAHGSKEMPMWGPAFASLSGGAQSEQGPQVQMRIYNLSRYIETLQAK